MSPGLSGVGGAVGSETLCGCVGADSGRGEQIVALSVWVVEGDQI